MKIFDITKKAIKALLAPFSLKGIQSIGRQDKNAERAAEGAEMGGYKNAEQYADETAGRALGNVAAREKSLERKAAGRIQGDIKLYHKGTHSVFLFKGWE